MKYLVMGLVLVSGLSAFAQRNYPERVFPARCNGNEMISNQGKVMYRFSFSTDCGRALLEANVNAGRFCDNDKLVRSNGTVASVFTHSSGCQKGLRQLAQSRVGLFCNERDLIQIRTQKIASMSFHSDCDIAIQHAGWYRGRFCNGGLMMDHYGRVLGDYGLVTSCRAALQRF